MSFPGPSSSSEEREVSPPISALQSLALSRKSNDLRGFGSGSKGARGTAGLNRGGRAGLARRNLASLAPTGLPSPSLSDSREEVATNGSDGKSSSTTLTPQKRPAAINEADLERRTSATNPSSSTTASTSSQSQQPPKVSKLASLAAGRSKPSSTSAATSPTTGSSSPIIKNSINKSFFDATSSSPSSTKPLSKLQLKMMEKQKAKELAASSSSVSGAAAEGMIGKDQEERVGMELDEIESPSLLPTGASIASLFPSLPGIEGNQLDPKPSSSRMTLVPGGSPFRFFISSKDSGRDGNGDGDGDGDSEDRDRKTRLENALAGNSPDDLVLKARAGTSLGNVGGKIKVQ